MQKTLNSSWSLFTQSWGVLRADKHLIIFPILSSIACLLILASFAVPTGLFLVASGAFSGSEEELQQIVRGPLWYLGLFVFYLINFFVVTFFNSALVACANARFAGQDSSARAGLAIAMSRLPQIFAWSIFAATVGMILRAIAERLGFIGSIVIRLVGMAWAIATYFVVPVLVVEGLGPIAAIKRSVEVLRRNWGESLTLHLGMGLIGFLLTLAALLPAAAGITAGVLLEQMPLLIAGVALTVVALIALALITSTLKVIIQAALYRFAETGVAPVGFDDAMLRTAIRKK